MSRDFRCLLASFLLLVVCFVNPMFGGDNFKANGEAISIKIHGLAGEIEMKFAPIPTGEFVMGSPGNEKGRESNEAPLHKIKISKPFYLGMYEVTQEQWEAVMGSNPSHFSGNPKRPVENITWDDCWKFIKKLNEMKLGTFRLPTEAEWEYAYRAGKQTRFYWGDDPNNEEINDYAWIEKNSESKTHDVGLKKPNEWRLFDMSGNVWEWCQDWYGSYSSNDQVNPMGHPSGSYRVMRGGGWSDDTMYVRAANRCGNIPIYTRSDVGCRVVFERTQ